MKKNLLILSIVIFFTMITTAQTVTKFNGVVNSNSSVYAPTPATFSSAIYLGTSNIIFDKGGNGWVVEAGGNRVRMIDSVQANVYVRAGSLFGASGAVNNVAGSNAKFNNPTDLVMDTLGNIYVADAGNNCIRKISAYQGLQPQSVTTFAGVMGATTGGYLDSTGTLAKFNNPRGLAIDRAGNIFVADAGNHCIRKITPAGIVSTIAGNVLNPGNNNGTGLAASFQTPTGLGWYKNPETVIVNGVLQDSMELLITDPSNSNIRLLDLNANVVTTFAGTGTAGNTDGDALTQATFTNPYDVVMDTNQNIYVTDSYSNIIRKISGSCVTTFAGSTVNAGNAPASDTANGIGTNARFNTPSGITFFKGALYVADYGNNSIRKITVAGTPPVYAVAKFSINATGFTNTNYNLVDSSTGSPFSGIKRWQITPGSFTYVTGDSTTAFAQIKFTTKAVYTIRLTVSNCWGQNSITKTINVQNLGINELNADKFIAVYPNPTNGIFEIAINTIQANTIRVMDINGKAIINRKVSSSNESVDMTGFAKGIYILNISGNDFSLNKKLIVE